MENKTKCVICWQELGSKKQLLHGMKCSKHGIQEKLKLFLHPVDLKTLYNKSFFPEPRICNLCFVTVKQISKGIIKLNELLGMNINLKLYKPEREDWDGLEGSDSERRSIEGRDIAPDSCCNSIDTSKAEQNLTLEQLNSGCCRLTQRLCHKLDNHSSSAKQNALSHKTKTPHRPTLQHHCWLISHSSSGMVGNNVKVKCRSSRRAADKNFRNKCSRKKAVVKESCEVKFQHMKPLQTEDMTVTKNCSQRHNETAEDSDQVCPTSANHPDISGQNVNSEHNKEVVECNELRQLKNSCLSTATGTKRERQRTRTKCTLNQVNENRHVTRIRSSRRLMKLNDMKCKEQLPELKNDRLSKRTTSESDVTVELASDPDPGCGQMKTEFIVRRNIRLISSKNRIQKSQMKVMKQLFIEEHERKYPVSEMDIPDNTGKHSQEKLQELTEKLQTNNKRDCPQNIKCDVCEKKFSSKTGLMSHLIKIHRTENTSNFLHPPEKTVACDVFGCGRKFASRVYMKRHVTSYHLGRRPRHLPGIFFACKVEGCNKRFTFKSTLCRHNHLVHRKGDYKLNRAVVKYPCTHDGCDKEFNRRHLLKDHMQTEHGKMAKYQLSLQGRDDFSEQMCRHCGVVLSPAQILHHESTCSSSEAMQDSGKGLKYVCKLCGMEFGSKKRRQFHVQGHIENPSYKCEVEGCKETFFLRKSLDIHLWNHSKKVSICDFEGCTQTFDDQFQLAKHSKVHFDGKMKCPWRNCDSFFTALGTLKQHFLAHSRSLKASFGWDFMCDKCDRVFSSKHGLKKHKTSHEESIAGPSVSPKRNMFVCEEPGCEVQFSKHKEFFDHFLHHYTNTQTACGYEGCTEISSTMLHQAKHWKSHNGNKYLCPWQDCEKTFASSFFQVKKHLYKHILSEPTIATGRSYVCAQCDMAFRLETNLISHMAQHPEKSDYVCTVCGKKFQQNHLNRHMLTHRQEKPHACSHCGVRYGTVNGLRFHVLQTHKIGTWPFTCSYCSKGFISSTELRRHLPSHTKEKPFSCEQCGDTFATHTGLKGHQRKHTGQKYVCDVEGCGKVYTTSLSMRGHKAEHAGFSRTCSYCGKTYKNPYRHKCKAGKEAKLKAAEAPSRSNQAVNPSETEALHIPVAVATPIQNSATITSTVIAHDANIKQAEGNIFIPNPVQHVHLMPSNESRAVLGIPQDVPHTLPHALPSVPHSLPSVSHSLPSNHVMQERGQLLSVDMTGGTTINISGDCIFNNYVVLWSSQ